MKGETLPAIDCIERNFIEHWGESKKNSKAKKASSSSQVAKLFPGIRTD
jgi:hypothetical protein